MKLTDIDSKFRELEPGLEVEFRNTVHGILSGLLSRHGDRVRRLANEFSQDGDMFRAFGYKFLTFDSKTKACTGIDSARLDKAAADYARDQVSKFTFKLNRKLGNLLNVEILGLSVGSFTFRITGELASGEQVVVVQDRILNMSSKKKMFHQWPAQIYVNEKRVSEAAFKAIVEDSK